MRLAMKAKTSAYPASTSSAAVGNWPCIESWSASAAEAGLGLVEAGQLAEDDQQQLRNRDTEDQAGRQPPGEPVVVLPAPFGPRMCDLHRSLRLHGPSFAGGPDIPYLS